ncbi:inverse autotransporter beta domain-containing protein [Serratia symbiotica]|nr:inverse autotransporter beta domain-containing protein [Serratia symbiotica]MBF1995135.1 inverse autotransporter beta domain-containing protein [Serratia symbiotica]QTP15853.1 inverse autotransporter beta domain-containing protein [Serratia symbiotica]
MNLAFPQRSPELALALMPADADSPSSFLRAPADLATLRTRVHPLSSGETTASVAKTYNMSYESLRKLNQFRTFARSFEHLQPGDEIDVPLAPLPAVQWDNAPGQQPSSPQDDAQAQTLATVATQTGEFFAHHPNSDAAASMARGLATGQANAHLQQWLSHVGTARVQLDMDKNFSLKNSQLDLLFPLYEQKDKLFFTQGSLHHTDSRQQSNLGLGYRWFNDGWMLGGNTFLDYDFSRRHARLGIGAEYWRDFLKLGTNHYFPLSNWQDLPELEGYQARPARGWDIRLQSWLPALPQLGGKLAYEKYYGNEVALLDREHRQHNAEAITASISYTPFPLLTLNAEYLQGRAGEKDARFGIQLNYQLGVPWPWQINSDAVAAMRSLAGSRRDLVERNNNIVLEYRKKEGSIRLYMVSLVKGYGGEQKSLGVSVSSVHGLDRIDWSAPLLLAANGSILQDEYATHTVILPNYQPGPQGINTYTISGVAVSKEGHESNRHETQVIVLPPDISEKNSTFTPASSTLLANGKSTQVLTLSLRDEQHHPVEVSLSDIALIGSEPLKSATISTLERKEMGVYEVAVTAGTDNETVMLTPSVMGVELTAAQVHIKAATPPLTADPVTAVWGDAPRKLAVNGGNGGTRHFASANKKVVTVDNHGTLTFIGAGETHVTVTQGATGAYEAPAPLEVKVTVAKAEAKVDLSYSKTMKVGEVQSVVVNSNSDGKKVFKSSADIIAVTPEGKITALKPGQANITFTQEASNNYLPATHSLLVSAYGMPVVKNITLSRTGNVLIGSTLAATYDFYNQGTGSNASLFQWYYKSGEGKWLAPLAAEAKKLRWTPDSSYKGYEVRLGITPKGSEQTVIGTEVFSNSVRLYTTPEVKNIRLTGRSVAGETLKVEYDFVSSGIPDDGDSLRISWNYLDGNQWKRIETEGQQWLKIKRSYPGWKVRAEVTPRGSLSGIVGITRATNEVTIAPRTGSTHPGWILPDVNVACYWSSGDTLSWKHPENIPEDLELHISKLVGGVNDDKPLPPKIYNAYGKTWIRINEMGSYFSYLFTFKDKYGNESSVTSGGVGSRPLVGTCYGYSDRPSSVGRWID